MASTSEQGHSKNVANFETLISFCKGYGTKYAPSNLRLQITQLTTLLNTAQTKIQNVQNAKTAFSLATDERQKEFENLKKLSTKIMNSIGALGMSPTVIEDAKSINKKLQGTSPKSTNKDKIENAEGQSSASVENKTISTSQQSHDKLIEHFSLLIQLLTQNPTYNPNEVDLKLATLNTKLIALKTKNTNLKTTYTNYSNAQIDRNKTLYDPTTGVVQTAKEIKLYVKSLFGTTSPEYKQISGLQFTLPR